MFTFLLAAALTSVPSEEIAHLLLDWAKPKYSNSETSLAYLAPDEKGAYNLCVDGKILTHTRRAIFNFFWEKDDLHLLYLYDEKGDENYHLYRTDLSGNSEDLTPFQDVHVEFIDTDKSHKALIGMNLRDPRFVDCYKIDLETKEIKPVLPQQDHRVKILAGENLEPRVAMNWEPDGRKFLEVFEEGWHPVCALDPDDWYADADKLSSDKQKAIILSSVDLPTRGLYAIDLKTGEKELLFSHPTLDCLKGYLNPKDGSLQAAYVRDGLLQWHFFDPEFEAEIRAIEHIVERGEITLLSRLAKDRKWFVAHRRDDSPNGYYLWDRDTKELKLVLQESPELLKYTFGKMESFHFTASDGQKIQGYLLKPPFGDPPYPTILHVHGGPHMPDQWGFIPQQQYWASRGYALLFINYRATFGFGKKFLMADKGEWSGRVFQDLLDGKRWAVEQGWADPNRIAIKGGSMGGYLTLLGISMTPNEFVCGIADFPLVEPSTWMPQGYVIWDFVCDKLFREAGIGAKSPLNYAHQIKVPLHMMHSDNDLRVRVSQSQQFAELLRLYRIPFTYHVLLGDGHGYLDPEHRRYYVKEIDAFLSKHL